MKLNIKWTLALAASMYFLSGCNNDSSTTADDKKDTSTSQSSNSAKDTTSNMGNKSMSNDLMASMNSMMDRMKAVQMTGDFDIDFANMMTEHHQGAVAMSEKEVSAGEDEKIKSMAQQIITSQKEEIQKLQDFVKSYKPSGMKHGEGELQKSMSDMDSKMKAMKMSGDMDKDFAAMMNVHHEGAVNMSKKELTNGMSSKLKQMAQKGINEQTKEIKEFKTWLDAHK
jgi:uncharacterized protein (DUF305 family)